GTERRIRRLGLEDRITLLKNDYRELKGQYDKLVSVEMIEAVGLDYMPRFFRKCESLLKPEGEMILQSITIADQRYEQARRSVDFIQRYIFPGGALPSLTALNEAATRYTDLRAFDLQDITAHYALTLQRWREAFRKNLHLVGSLGFDARFIRMWEYYLCYCEAGFRERAIGCVQIRFHRPNYRTPELS
ncbi:MAG: class I SAM-dependent methyltransferase, partial [Pseudomonadales bacterium]|nr:class I SAM-dependent methyltransferase [Pseudomonadales bacterium]